ncbi:MAG: insulinase family protein, partial [Methyloprofundus sp.]|nr:insulinase family protein [Methyloprofundus sp.]
MLFDKEVELEDLISEKGAVQTEIGAYQWIDKPFWYLYQLIEKLTPPQPDIYQDDFALPEMPKQSARYKQKINNQSFTLAEVMAHYKTYYYPANMILKIAGNFDMPAMKKHVQTYYGSLQWKGTEKAQKPIETPQLNQKPYRLFVEGSAKNVGYLGVKYVLDDYRKYLIISAYLDNLALRLQQNLRNDLGHSYSIYASSSSRDKARLAYIYFDGLHDEFESNIIAVRKALSDDQKHLSNATIDNALREYKKHYTAVEHDSGTLMRLINTTQYLNETFASPKTSYQFFDSINHENFRATLKEAFVDKHLYSIIYREYYLFPHDVPVLSLLAFIVMLIAYFKLHYLDKIACSDRNITMNRRISNRFIGFIYILTIYFLSAFLWAWIKYLFLNYILGNNVYTFGIDVPYSYLWTISDMVISILIFLTLCRYLFPYFSRLVVTKEGICLIGHRVKTIAKADIAEIQTTKWQLGQSLKSFGSSILFWKPLVKISLKDGQEIYIRNKQAEHLKEDLETQLSEGSRL